jgi:hypothetical protein
MAQMYEAKKLMQMIRRMYEIPTEHRVQVMAAISRLGAVEAEPVKRTSWEQKPRGEHGFYEERCKACGEWSLGMDKPYCPMCGAQADGGANDGK